MKPLVLVIDDEFGVRDSLRLVLETSYRVRCAENGEQGLEALRDELPDVVLLDLIMPGIGGVETLGRIREFSNEVEVVIITAHGSYATAVETLRLRAFDYLRKPFDPERVRSIVDRAVESRRLRGRSSQDRFEISTRQMLELLDALTIECSSEIGGRFFVDLDYARLLVQMIRDHDLTKTQSLCDQLDVLQSHLLPEEGISTRRTLDRVRRLLDGIGQEA